VVLTAYFDESIRQEGDEPICVGGYVFKSKGYERFCDRWRRSVLRLTNRTRLPHFHMTDLCAGRGEYSSLSIDERIGILDRAVGTIVQHAHKGVAVYFSQADFVDLAPPNWPQHFGSTYAAACRMCMELTAQRLTQIRCHLGVAYVFEAGHRRQAEADDVLGAMARHPQSGKYLHYRGHRFGTKDEPGLQAADLLCWSLTKAKVARGKAPVAFKPFLPVVRRLADETNDRMVVYNFTGDLLKDFFLSQTDRNMPRASAPLKFRPGKRAFR
jgi:hypothetical protein